MELRDLGPRVRAHDPDYDDLGVAHLPARVQPGDLVAFPDGSAWQIVDVVDAGGSTMGAWAIRPTIESYDMV
jgi:hypothetical protein